MTYGGSGFTFLINSGGFGFFNTSIDTLCYKLRASFSSSATARIIQSLRISSSSVSSPSSISSSTLYLHWTYSSLILIPMGLGPSSVIILISHTLQNERHSEGPASDVISRTFYDENSSSASMSFSSSESMSPIIHSLSPYKILFPERACSMSWPRLLVAETSVDRSSECHLRDIHFY